MPSSAKSKLFSKCFKCFLSSLKCLFRLTEFPSDNFLKTLDILQKYKYAKQMYTPEYGCKVCVEQLMTIKFFGKQLIKTSY